MGTRSRIGLETANGAVYSIYCHWDGYPSHNGRILLEHYSDPIKLRELIDLGNISSLAPAIGKKHNFDKNPEGEVNAYGRDRGDTDIEAEICDTREEFFAKAADEGWEEYLYLWTDSPANWIVTGVGGDCGPFLAHEDTPANWALLMDVLAMEEAA